MLDEISPLCSRMGVIIGAFESFFGDMGVDLSGRQRGVAEQ